MESTDEGGGGGELGLGLGFAEIGAVAEGLGRSEVFHIVKEVIGFVLYMHHQIPSVLQSLENEFVALKEEFKNLVDSGTMPAETKASDQRKHNMRKREVKQGIKRQEKLMNGISSLLSALQDALDELPSIQGVTLVLGGSLARPLHVCDMLFSNGRFDSGSAKECTKSKVAQTLSRKAIRALISSGAGSTSTGPCKLFLLMKCPCTFNLPLHFSPKREFHYTKKVVPFRLHIKCKAKDKAMNDQHSNTISSSCCMSESAQTEDIWFQCRHTVKGLACKAPTEC
ncbi:uncharacterized protein LOC109728236 [Ananas comosus]|uniref:Uncharacterized protein LOC109728236 n=1 Tax=Ananas comosus TaxID=4615 RepID=A0A6P5H2A8_ANACO|nr:uncharacterized protein LOC109728236 [Ananas comosus]